MSSWAFAVPILQGREGDPARLATQIHERWDEYLGSRMHARVTMERVYQMDTPSGSFNIVYGEGQSFHQTMYSFRTSMKFFDGWMLEQIGRFSGLDFHGMPIPPEPVQVLNYTDPDVQGRKKGLAFAAPIAWENVGSLLSFFGEVRGFRSGEMLASRRAKSLWRDTVFLNETPMGPMVCVYIEGDDPRAANEAFARSTTEFDLWFKENAGTALGIDLSQPLPEVKTILDWQLVDLDQKQPEKQGRHKTRRLPA